jgi:hypothetical protein
MNDAAHLLGALADILHRPISPSWTAVREQLAPAGPPSGAGGPGASARPRVPHRPLAADVRRGDGRDARHRERHAAPAGSRARASGRAAQLKV